MDIKPGPVPHDPRTQGAGLTEQQRDELNSAVDELLNQPEQSPEQELQLLSQAHDALQSALDTMSR